MYLSHRRHLISITLSYVSYVMDLFSVVFVPSNLLAILGPGLHILSLISIRNDVLIFSSYYHERLKVGEKNSF